MTGIEIFKELEGLDADLILSAAPGEAIPFPKRRGVYKKLMACAAALALILGTVSFVGFDKVSASVREIFSFIPGIGIQERDDSQLYTWLPVTGRVENGDEYGEIWLAAYQNSTLSLLVHMDGGEYYSHDMGFYINGIQQNVSFFASVSRDNSLLELSFPMEAPAEDDLYEISIRGFAQRLSFTMKSCENYEDLNQIGPTATANDISVTVTANRVGDELVLWYYAYKHPGATTDEIRAFGHASTGALDNVMYVETENGKLTEKLEGWTLYNRDVYEISQADRTATLYIPYLDMLHREEGRLHISFPMEYGSFASDADFESDLGTVRVSRIERKESQDNPGMDEIVLYFAYDSKDENKSIHHLSYNQGDLDCMNYSSIVWQEDGSVVEALVLIVEPDREDITLTISGVYYYLMGEYVIPLDIRE